MIEGALVFSRPPIRLRHMRGGVGRCRPLISSHSGRLAAWLNQRNFLCTNSAGIHVRHSRHRSFINGIQSPLHTCRIRRIVKDRQHPFVGCSYWPCHTTVEQNRVHHCLVDPALCTQRYFTPRLKTGLQARECGAGKIDPSSDPFCALAVGVTGKLKEDSPTVPLNPLQRLRLTL